MAMGRSEEEIKSMTERESSPINRALAELSQVEGYLHATGAVDVEAEQIHVLRTRLLQGELSPEETVKSARKILEQRYDYH